MNIERTETPVLQMNIEGIKTYQDIQRMMVEHVNIAISYWHKLPHSLKAELIVPDDFTFDLDKKTEDPLQGRMYLKLTKPKGIFIPRLDMIWCKYLITSIESTGSKMFMTRPEDFTFLKGKIRQKIGVEYQFHPRGVINFNNQK